MNNFLIGGVASAIGYTWGAYKYGGIEGLFNGLFLIAGWLVVLVIYILVKALKKRYKIVRKSKGGLNNGNTRTPKRAG